LQELALSEKIRLIKKYPNRRLYDTETSIYITLSDIKKLVQNNTPFRVEDAKSKEDITRSILMQIILEEETLGSPIFSCDLLSQIIRFYGHTMQGMMGTFLEKNVHTFMDIQNKMHNQSSQLFSTNPMANVDAWNEFLKMQGPAVQGLMGQYLEQSAQAFVDMQQRLQNQTKNMFSFPFPGFTNPSESTNTDSDSAQSNPKPGADK
jgi:polyhydroxyalkanoate synthesis repressor PhaR